MSRVSTLRPAKLSPTTQGENVVSPPGFPVTVGPQFATLLINPPNKLSSRE